MNMNLLPKYISYKQSKEYIVYSNNERIQVKLKGLTPIQYGNQSLQ